MPTDMNFTVDTAGNLGRLSLADDNGGELSVEFSADDVLRFIKYLGVARSVMTPPISGHLGSKPTSDPEDFVTPEPASFAVDSLLDGHRMLMMRHSGYGWISYRLTQTDADSMATMLTLPAENPLSRTQGNA